MTEGLWKGGLPDWAGPGNCCSVDGPASVVKANYQRGAPAIDKDENVYWSDGSGNAIRVFWFHNQSVTTIAGVGAAGGWAAGISPDGAVARGSPVRAPQAISRAF